MRLVAALTFFRIMRREGIQGWSVVYDDTLPIPGETHIHEKRVCVSLKAIREAWEKELAPHSVLYEYSDRVQSLENYVVAFVAHEAGHVIDLERRREWVMGQLVSYEYERALAIWRISQFDDPTSGTQTAEWKGYVDHPIERSANKEVERALT